MDAKQSLSLFRAQIISSFGCKTEYTVCFFGYPGQIPGRKASVKALYLLIPNKYRAFLFGQISCKLTANWGQRKYIEIYQRSIKATLLVKK